MSINKDGEFELDGKLLELQADEFVTAVGTLETLPEAKAVLKNGGRVEFIDLIEGKSTTNVIKTIENK